MSRVTISKAKAVLSNGDYLVDALVLANEVVNIEIEVNSQADILFNNIKDIKELNIVLKQGSYAKISFLCEDEVKNSKICITVLNNAVLDGYFADFSKDTLNLKCLIKLAEEGATGNYKIASLVAGNDRKVIDVSIDHDTKKTYGKFDCFGICKDSGHVLVSGESHIYKGSIKSKTQQNCRIMVFDEKSIAVAKPILRIDENDLEASHAAIVGKINDEHLFYLTSRGLTEETAKELITLGYLKPILEGFKDEMIINHISTLIEGRM